MNVIYSMRGIDENQYQVLLLKFLFTRLLFFCIRTYLWDKWWNFILMIDRDRFCPGRGTVETENKSVVRLKSPQVFVCCLLTQQIS